MPSSARSPATQIATDAEAEDLASMKTGEAQPRLARHRRKSSLMKNDARASPARKVGIYDRPTAADRPRGLWVVAAVAIAIAIGWGVFLFL